MNCGQKQNKISILCAAVVSIAAAAVLLQVIGGTALQGKELLPYSLLYLAAVLLCCMAIIKLPVNEKYLLWAVMAVCAITRFYYIALIDTPPASDFEALYNAAEKTVGGDMSWLQDRYFARWAYQIPFVLYEAFVIKLFGGITALKIINVIFMLGIDYLIYLMAEKIAGKRAALCAAFLYAVYPDAVHLSSVLTNQHIAAFFLLLALYFLLRDKRGVSAALAGAMLGISQLMRPEAVLVLAAADCMAIWLFLQEPHKDNLKNILLRLALLVLCYLLVTKLTALILSCVGAAPFGLKNNVPEWKFVLGLDFGGSGVYSDNNAYILGLGDAAQRKAETAEIIKSSFAACPEPMKFFDGKIKILWVKEIGGSWSMMNIKDTDTLLPFLSAAGFKFHLSALNAAVYLVIWLAALAATVMNLFSPGDNRSNFLTVLLLGFFAVFLLVEVQSRYRYAAIPLAVILSAKAFSLMERKGKT